MQGIIFSLRWEAEQSARCHYVLKGKSAPEKSLSPVVKLASCPSRATKKSQLLHGAQHLTRHTLSQKTGRKKTITTWGLRYPISQPKQTRLPSTPTFPPVSTDWYMPWPECPPRKASLCSGECYAKSPANPRGSVRGNRSGLKAKSSHTKRKPVSKRSGRVAANGTSKEETELRRGLEVGGSKLPQAALFVQALQVIDSVKHARSKPHGQQSLA